MYFSIQAYLRRNWKTEKLFGEKLKYLQFRAVFDPWIRDPGSGMGKKSGYGSGIRIRDEQPGSYFR